MAKTNNPIIGAQYLLRGFNLIRQPRLRKYVIIPLLINTSLFMLLGYFAFSWLGSYIDEVTMNLPEWIQWLQWLVIIILGFGFALFVFFTFTLVANFICSPFNGPLSEAVEQIVGSGSTTADAVPWHESFSTLPATFREEWSKMSYSLIRSVPFLIFMLIPGINFIASALWTLFSAWILALQYTDYPFANHQQAFAEQRRQLRTRLGLVMGFGGAVLAGTMVPLLNLVIIPSAVAGATLLYLEQFKEEDNLGEKS